ncbi:hypothetical protein BKA82DRAFT_4010717 [Pisolithus tinctorius]|nr:hypothetical protein BKA82DRAFT_4010717 [Pisolithus tinctorius]
MKPKPRPGSDELKEWLKSSGTVDSILMWNMPNSIFSCIKYYKTALEMFNYLATTYGNPNPISIPVKCPDELSSEPPKEVRLEGNSHNEARSSDEVKAEATVEVAQVKSAEVKGKTSGMVRENKAMKRGLGEEATDEIDGQDITAKEMVNLKADGGDTEICHTSNRPEHKQLERANNDRPARIIEVRVSPSDGTSSYPQTGRTELKEEWDSSCASSTVDQPSGGTDVPQHYVDDPSSNTKDMGGSTIQATLAPAKHPREGVGTTAGKQHAAGEMSCNELDGHAEPKDATCTAKNLL